MVIIGSILPNQCSHQDQLKGKKFTERKKIRKKEELAYITKGGKNIRTRP